MAKDEEEKNILVVTQLPSQAVRSATIDEKEYNLITVEEALTEMLDSIRHIKKALA